MKEIKPLNKCCDDPNSEIITNFLMQELPQFAEGHSEVILDAIYDILVGSRQIRLAGKPKPESAVAIREVIREAMDKGVPIPILIVSGPKKSPLHESIDIAELSMLKIINSVYEQVTKFYRQGLEVRIRLEDTTGMYLENHLPTSDLMETMDQYCNDLQKLVRILGYTYIRPFRETEIVSPEHFAKMSEEIATLLFDYMVASAQISDTNLWSQLESYKKLEELGWKGIIPHEMREYYRNRYLHLFPEWEEKDRLIVTAKYLASTLVRYKTDAIGRVIPGGRYWSNYIQINFAPPVPGMPNTLATTRLYYRTMTLNNTKKHAPYWRTKGILVLNGNVRMSLMNWDEQNETLTPFAITFSDDNESVNVNADYILED